MKGKGTSSHHRSENTYRFQTFAERLATVNVDVARRVQKLSATPEDADTFFGQALRKWLELNCTQHFADFKKEVSGTVFTFAQLIHHQKKIVSAILKHLQVPNSLAYQPLLDLIVQVARDLQSDFYVYFEDVLPVLITLLHVHHHNTEILEQTFTCLSYIFKFLWRAMLADIKRVYVLISPLLGNEYREYINNFAAESFAFLMRKVKDFPDLCEYMFMELEDHPDQISGVGRLLFESVKGVQKQLHSAAGKILPVVFEKLAVSSLPLDHVCDCLQYMLDSIAVYTVKEHTEPVWTPLLATVEAIYLKWDKAKAKKKVLFAAQLKLSLQLVHRLITYKKGSLVLTTQQLVKLLTVILEGPTLPTEPGEMMLVTVSALLMGERVTVPIKDQSALLQLVYKSGYHDKYKVSFTKSVLGLPMFEKDVLPPLLAFCAQCFTDEKSEGRELAIQALSHVISYKAPVPADGESLDSFSTYMLDFGSISAKNETAKKVPGLIIKKVDELIKSLEESSLPLLWAAVSLVPHIRPLKGTDCKAVLMRVFTSLIKYLEKNPTSSDSCCCIVADTVLALMQKLDLNEFYDTLKFQDILNFLSKCPENGQALRAAALYFTQANSEKSCAKILLTEENFIKLLPLIEGNLSSPHSKIRLLVLQICCQFDLPMPARPDDEDDREILGLFRICLEAEKVEVGVNTVREKLMHLRKLDFDILQHQIPLGPYHTVALRYLIGMLYVNFTMMWEPTMELIQSHATGLKAKVFWEVFEQFLDKAATMTESLFDNEDDTKNQPKKKVSDEDGRSLELPVLEMVEAFQLHQSRANPRDRPDYFNFRKLLWNTMQYIPGLTEPKSKIIVPMFFRFLEKEFYPANHSIAPTQNLGVKNVSSKTDDDDDEEEDEEDEEEGEKQKQQMKKRKQNRSKQRPYNAYLVSHLNLFAKFKNPRNMHGESRLRELYYEFLPHRNPKIQKAAFECILTYKYKFLMPYKENLEKLMDDKTFKNEIVLFSVDKDNSIIQEEHREGILPVLMAILYGKMQTKTGRDTGGRSHSNVRRSIIFRFLGGCQQHELRIFFDLVFKPFLHYTKGNIFDVVNETIEATDVSEVIPLKKQQSVLSTIETVLLKLGSLVDDYLPSILRIIVGILAQVSTLLDSREELFEKAVVWLKSLRLVALQKLDKFFSTYTSYPFTNDEIESIFKVAIWPQLERLPNEGVHSPSGLLTLFLTWSQHPRYLNLLQKTWSESSFSVLPMVVQLFNSKAASPRVQEVVMDIVYNLITQHDSLEEEEMEEEEEAAPAIDVGPVVEDSPPEGVPLGVHLMLRHVPAVLTRLKSVVEDMLNKKGRMKTLPAKELKVLACLSQYVTDSDQCGDMVSLLLPFLNRNMNRSVDVEMNILEAAQHLVQRAPQPDTFLRPIAKLFSSLSARSSRAALCDTLQAIAQREASYKNLADVVSKLNSWDKKFIEEPDYLARIDAFRTASEMITPLVGEDYITYTLMVIHNCTFFINTMADMSLRDSSSLCLQKTIADIAGRPNNMDAVNTVIKNNLIPEVKSGLKQLSEVSRHEYIILLSHLVKNFPAIPVFKDMTPLIDTDPEVDFFTNMTHIQLHRRGRAMRRITRMLSERPLMTETMVAFLLPMITTYLRDETYHKEATIMDAVVETVSSMTRCLPWHHYLSMLKYYLGQLPRSLDNQKLMVRMIVAVLDSFHFDLRNSTEISSTALKAPGVAKEEVKPPQPALEGSEVKTTGTSKTPTAEDVKKETEGKATSPEGKIDVEKENDKEVKEEDEGLNVEDEDFTQSGGDLGGETTPSVFGSVTVCSPKLATKIHQTVIKEIIPGLHSSLTRKTKSDDEHKKARASKFAEDEEVLRVPIALALVKLMQGLPHKTLDFNLPGVLLKVCHFLRSRAIDIRTMARDTLGKIMQSLGPRYFPYVLKELRLSLKRGYQYHVLCFTINMILENLRSSFKSGDLDSSVEGLVDVFNHEIFGDISEEKEVIGITSKLMEAKTSKSFDSYAILIKYITKSSLSKIFTPLKSILEASSSHKTSKKVEEILRRLIPGLVTNSSLELNDLMTFVYGLTNDVMPLLNPQKPVVKSPVTPKVGQQPTDTYIVQPNPSRKGSKPKNSIKTNMHIIIEFGLQILYTLLKQSTLNSKVLEHAKLLDPFVVILTTCLTSKYIKVISTSLRCVIWVFKFPLPSLKKHVKKMANSLFVLLKTYGVTGAAATGDNFELIDMCFKAVTVLLRDVSFHTIHTDQLKVLLTYAEQDIHDHTRRATAFSLLKAILTRKLVVPEMHDVINKIEELSISAHDGQVRQNCRQVAIKFLLNYPLGPRLERHLEFYVAQLEYEHDTGRESALEMLATIFETFPTKLLHEFAGFFFVPLARQLVNDDSAKCRKQAALAMKHLISKLESDKRDQLFSITIEWFKSDKVALRKLAALTCGVIVEVESTKFERHLTAILPIIEQQTDPTRYNMSDTEGEERELDHLLFSILTLLCKIMRECNLIRKEKWATELNTIWGHLEEHLLYPHVWVRLISAQIFGLLFAAWTPQELLHPSKKQAKRKAQLYLQHNSVEKLHDLCGLFCKQLAETQMDQELATQMLKNLVFLGKVLRHLPKHSRSKSKKAKLESNGDGGLDENGEEQEEEDEESDVREKTASLEWLSTRLCGEVYAEIANNPKETTKRTSVFKWIAAMSLELGQEGLPEFLPKFLPILVREITDKSPNADENLKKLSQEVIDLLKTTVGVETFTQHYATILKTLVEKRQTRKRERATELVANPELAAKKKLKKNLSKQKAKKRRIEDLRPVKKAKKHKMAEKQYS